jgi:hypothetical protein
MTNIKVLQAFIQYEFKNLPGSAWVDQGRYLVSSLANDRSLDEHNWTSYVAPGARIAMSMIVRKHLEPSNLEEERCPDSTCSGTWKKLDSQSWVTW